MTTKAVRIACLVTLLIALGSAPVLAERGDKNLRFGVLFALPTGDLAMGDDKLQLEDTFGAQASFEFLATGNLGIEPALTWGNHDAVVTGPQPDLDIGEIDLLTLTFNFNFHVLPNSRTDLFLGPTIGYAFWGDLKSDLFAQNFAAEDEFTYGFNIGVDVPCKSEHWAFSAVVNYLVLDVSLEGQAPQPDLSVDPFQFKIGIAYKF